MEKKTQHKFWGWNEKPKEQHVKRVLVSITPNLLAEMDDFAIDHELSRSELVRRGVELYMEVQSAKDFG